MQLRNAWRRVQQRLPEDRGAASAADSEAESPSSSGNANAAGGVHAAALATASMPEMPRNGRSERPQHSASLSRSSQATATVSITAAHPARDVVRGAVAPSTMDEVEQPLSCSVAAQHLPEPVAEAQPDTPEPPSKKARPAVTAAPDTSPVAESSADRLVGSALEAAAVSNCADLASEQMPAQPHDASPPPEILPASVTLGTGGSQPALQEVDPAGVDIEGGRPPNATPDSDADRIGNGLVEPSQPALTCITPSQMEPVEAVPTTVTPSTVELEVVQPSTITLRRAVRRRRGKACQAPSEPQQPATPAVGGSHKAKSKRKR